MSEEGFVERIDDLKGTTKESTISCSDTNTILIDKNKQLQEVYDFTDRIDDFNLGTNKGDGVLVLEREREREIDTAESVCVGDAQQAGIETSLKNRSEIERNPLPSLKSSENRSERVKEEHIDFSEPNRVPACFMSTYKTLSPEEIRFTSPMTRMELTKFLQSKGRNL